MRHVVTLRLQSFGLGFDDRSSEPSRYVPSRPGLLSLTSPDKGTLSTNEGWDHVMHYPRGLAVQDGVWLKDSDLEISSALQMRIKQNVWSPFADWRRPEQLRNHLH